MSQSLREIYDKISADEYYQSDAPYVNHHADQVRKLLFENSPDLNLGSILDLACGDGLVTNVLKEYLGKREIYTYILGCDPYTAVKYKANTGRPCIELSFKDIIDKGFSGIGYGLGYRNIGCIICSFALHLCPKSMLPDLTWRLSEISETLVVISPNKFPNLGIPKVEKFCLTPREKRVHYRVYDLPIVWYKLNKGP